MEERLMAGTFDGEGSRSSPNPEVGELEANYPPYCKAMRILAREGKSATKARRTPSAGSGWRCCTTA